MMSRKDYVRFAAMFAGEIALVSGSPKSHSAHSVRGIILSSADIFAQDNPRFDRARFYVASGLTAEGNLS